MVKNPGRRDRIRRTKIGHTQNQVGIDWGPDPFLSVSVFRGTQSGSELGDFEDQRFDGSREDVSSPGPSCLYVLSLDLFVRPRVVTLERQEEKGFDGWVSPVNALLGGRSNTGRPVDPTGVRSSTDIEPTHTVTLRRE